MQKGIVVMGTHRISVTLPDDLREEIETLKNELDCNISYSKLINNAIYAGIEIVKNKEIMISNYGKEKVQ